MCVLPSPTRTLSQTSTDHAQRPGDVSPQKVRQQVAALAEQKSEEARRAAIFIIVVLGEFSGLSADRQQAQRAEAQTHDVLCTNSS
jgi:hypothetical protein